MALTREAKLHEQCMEAKQKCASKAPFVVFMLEKIKAAGCVVDMDRHVQCRPCPPGRTAGAFDPSGPHIVLCENNFFSEKGIADVLTHELIHAYDYCRGQVDFKNPHHVACTEVRASSLSGDCFFWKELNRLQLGFKAQHQRCVRRRAAASVGAALGLTPAQSSMAVDQVFDVCFRDTAPFDRVP